MSEKTTKDKKERTLSLKPGLVSSTKAKGSRSSRASTVVVWNQEGEGYHKQESPWPHL